MEERLQKILSQAGICSRRKAEDYLLQGRITVNGKPATLGDKADLAVDKIHLDGVILTFQDRKTYVMLNKPKGYVTTLSDEKGRRTVVELLKDMPTRLWPVGRLDMNSEGLLLLTNDGELTQRLLHPSYEVEKEYLTWVQGEIEAALPVLTAPMELDGEAFLPAKVKVIKQDAAGGLLSIVICQGKNRQVRRMCAHAQLKVVRLKRVREGSLYLDKNLKPGQGRELTPTEYAQLSAPR